MTTIYHRPALAVQMARQLLKPSALDQALRSGLFLSGLRRTGKTTFLRNDLIPALEDEGALVIYIDLWSDTQTSPAKLVHAAVRKTLDALRNPASSVLEKLKRVRGIDVGAFGFNFGFKVEEVGQAGGAPLADVLTEVVDQVKTDVVLIIDEVQHAITSDEGRQLLLALKAARDAINPRPHTPGHFVFMGTGSHRAMVSELTARRNQAFAGATTLSFPVLDRDYVAFLLDLLKREGVGCLPSLDVATRAFEMLGHRPEEMLRALRQLLIAPAPDQDPDAILPVIATTLRSAAADVELIKVEELGALAQAVFDRIATAKGRSGRLYSADAASAYSAAIGREVRIEEIQPVVTELLAANLILRRGHGVYEVTDPFVQEIWVERKLLARL